METKFNFNSQICTSREQSERLLALGLKKETADMWRGFLVGGETIVPTEEVDLYNFYVEPTPAWGLHRLIEMMPENVSDDWLGVSFDDVSYYHGEGEGMIGWKFIEAGNLYDCMVKCYEWLIENGSFKKEYLEE